MQQNLKEISTSCYYCGDYSYIHININLNEEMINLIDNRESRGHLKENRNIHLILCKKHFEDYVLDKYKEWFNISNIFNYKISNGGD